jgi:hypothetical protein
MKSISPVPLAWAKLMASRKVPDPALAFEVTINTSALRLFTKYTRKKNRNIFFI